MQNLTSVLEKNTCSIFINGVLMGAGIICELFNNNHVTTVVTADHVIAKTNQNYLPENTKVYYNNTMIEVKEFLFPELIKD